ncbi:MAG: protein-disulfide reductase DsbD N-terminal domain-containing protein [Acidobacteriia bacterium]|nr:protein-disulfide reductase DsbD N-terminal domain-containing protein [Terriglobia bacterium]
MLRKPVLCVLLGASSLSFAQTSVLLIPKPEPVVAKAGTTVEVKLPLQLREGYHVNTNAPPDPYLVPLRLTWESGPITVAEIVYPKPEFHKVDFFAGQLPIFTGRFELLTRFKVPASIQPGLVNVAGKLRYQACNDRMCLAPKTVDLTLPVSVSR